MTKNKSNKWYNSDFCKCIAGTFIGGLISLGASSAVIYLQIENEKHKFLSVEAIATLTSSERCVDSMVSDIKEYAEYIKSDEQIDPHVISKRFNQPINDKIRDCKTLFKKLSLGLKYSGCLAKEKHINFSFINDLKTLFNNAVKNPLEYNGKYRGKNDDFNKDISEELNQILAGKRIPQMDELYNIMDHCS